MPYEVLERQIKSLPQEALQEVSHYVTYLAFLYKKREKTESISKKIDAFMKENPDAFNEFKAVQESGIESIRELTKNDVW